MSFDKWHPFNHVPAYQWLGSPDNPRWPRNSLALAIGEFCETEPQREAADEVARVTSALRKLVDAVNAECARCQIWDHPELDTAVDSAAVVVETAERYKERVLKTLDAGLNSAT